MLTIRDLVNNMMIQGEVEVREVHIYDGILWETSDFGGITKELEPFADREIVYMYSQGYQYHRLHPNSKEVIAKSLIVIEIR